MKTPLRAVVFDLDGTLLDSMPMVMRAYSHALSPYFPEMSEDELRSKLGGPADRMFLEMLSPTEAEEALRRLRDYSVENWKTMQPFTGMHAILDDLKGVHGVALWTGRERGSTQWLLDEHGIAGKIQTCVCGDDLGSHKPDPAGLAEVLRRLKVSADETIFVGDADVDVMAGHALNVRTILITHGRKVAPGMLAKAWRVAKNPEEAYAILRSESAAGAAEAGSKTF